MHSFQEVGHTNYYRSLLPGVELQDESQVMHNQLDSRVGASALLLMLGLWYTLHRHYHRMDITEHHQVELEARHRDLAHLQALDQTLPRVLATSLFLRWS